jgi:hypothetical protein
MNSPGPALSIASSRISTKPASPCTLRAPKRQPAQPVGSDPAIFHFGMGIPTEVARDSGMISRTIPI